MSESRELNVVTGAFSYTGQYITEDYSTAGGGSGRSPDIRAARIHLKNESRSRLWISPTTLEWYALPACASLPAHLQPTTPFTEEQIWSGLPEPGGFGFRDLRRCF